MTATLPLSSVEELPSARAFVDGAARDFADAVTDGLRRPRKALPSRFFYDARGSELFERITTLDAYYPTRTELGILHRYAPSMVDSGAPVDLIEFGAGSAAKTRTLLRALPPGSRYVPIDISASVIREGVPRLRQEFPHLGVYGLIGDWIEALDHLPSPVGPRVFTFLGSSIGNLTHTEAVDFLRSIATRMGPQDAFLLGIDRVKDARMVEAAYNDIEGVTEAFNKNLLRRINRELRGQFPVWRFRHRATYCPVFERIQMELEAREDMRVPIESLAFDVNLEKGERIHTEWSHKYSSASLRALADGAGMTIESMFSDPREWFSVVRLMPSLQRER